MEIRWVPRQEGVSGNEAADELAREGSSQLPTGPEPFLSLPGNYLAKAVHKHLGVIHLKNYRELDISDKGKTPLTHYLINHRYNSPRMTGTHLRWLTWLFTGHSPLAYFQWRANNFDSPLCKHCPDTQETSAHFLCECVGYMTIRLRTFGKVITTIEEMANTDTKLIISYIKQTGRFEQDDLFG